ncbi:MAG TPA: PaaX family transcriptional regulator C-terminal domain-containing protein [Candidatus Eremiobacteraceae bacterium]|nr:PaaX family transcriptional regulator C-terminal domain-containing protein [Candidatus Eremiobacteraceae bacterium]
MRARSMLFTLYGDYAAVRRTDVRLGALVEIGRVLGLSETAVRSAVARLASGGWLSARRDGGRSYYALSEAGRRLIAEGTERIYRPRGATWDGTWCILTYSIPERSRSVRDRVRKQLAWLGFGAMGPGAYISPRDVAAATQSLFREHAAHSFARIFTGRFDGPGTDRELVRQCWDLAAIARRYQAFIRHYAPLFRRDRVARVGDVEAFVTRFALTHDFRRFPFIDPDLPAELLPNDWAGARARRLFERHHALLRAGAMRFFDRAVRADG